MAARGRAIARDVVERTLGGLEALEALSAAGRSPTCAVDDRASIVEGLGLPAWTAAVTLVPIFADAGEGDALALAARVRAAVREAAADDGVDVSIGIATYPENGATELQLVAAADRAMYRGKTAGRAPRRWPPGPAP